jgi:hypothetical protein
MTRVGRHGSGGLAQFSWFWAQSLNHSLARSKHSEESALSDTILVSAILPGSGQFFFQGVPESRNARLAISGTEHEIHFWVASAATPLAFCIFPLGDLPQMVIHL